MVPVGGLSRRTQPLEQHPELFADFSLLQSPEEILAFATRYGWLGLSSYEQVPSRSMGESLGAWTRHIEELRLGLRIAELVQEQDQRALRAFIQWGDGQHEGIVRLCCRHESGKVIGCSNMNFLEIPDNGRQQIIISRESGQKRLSVWKRGESVGPAKLFLAQLIDRHLYKQISPRFVLDRNDSFRPYYYPSSLIAAMWLQFYRFLVGETKFRKCEICLKRMDVTENRSNKKVHNRCSTRLRMQRYRSTNVETR